MAKLNPKIGRSINDTLEDEVSGERQIGASAHSVTLGRKADGKPCGVSGRLHRAGGATASRG